MVIQIDIDGTINQAPAIFSAMTKALGGNGHRILVVSARVEDSESREFTTKQLREWRIDYEELILTPPFRQLIPSWFPPNLPLEQRAIFFKVMTARERRVDVAFEDDGLVIDLFRAYLPEMQVFQVLDHHVYRLKSDAAMARPDEKS